MKLLKNQLLEFNSFLLGANHGLWCSGLIPGGALEAICSAGDSNQVAYSRHMQGKRPKETLVRCLQPILHLKKEKVALTVRTLQLPATSCNKYKVEIFVIKIASQKISFLKSK